VTHRKEVKELLCILYCDRGDRKQNDSKFEEARKDFQAALEADSQNSRAKKSLGWTYLNQAADIGTDNLSKALDLMEQGMKHMGDDPKACGLMAQVCNLRAVELLDNLSSSTPLSRFDEAIRLLRRAIKLKNPEIEDSVLDVIVNEEAVEAIEERTKDFQDETYKKALQNLAYVGRFRRQKRAGDLNSEAVNILNSLAYSSYGGRHSVSRAIEMLEEAARILNPRIGAMLFMIEHMDEHQIRNIGGPAATILVNLSTAYKMRRQLGSYY
jgi:tetratricopeptide (TPR) repeat protein